MNNYDLYLYKMVQKYQARDLIIHSSEISTLKSNLRTWATSIYLIDIFDSGSRAKGTAISLASDVDYVVSLTSNCRSQESLSVIYNSLYDALKDKYTDIRKQNVSIRIRFNGGLLQSNGLEIDITPARKQPGNTNDHSIWVSKLNTWKQTNIQRHISDISNSGRINEIKLLKIWRELNKLDFPSIYLEYLIVNELLKYKPKGLDFLASNFKHILSELAKIEDNPLWNLNIVDPANSNNMLSDLLTVSEKGEIIRAAIQSVFKTNLFNIVF